MSDKPQYFEAITSTPATTVTLTFNMDKPDGRLECQKAMQGSACKSALWDINAWLRDQLRYGKHADDVQNILVKALDSLGNILEHHNVTLDD